MKRSAPSRAVTSRDQASSRRVVIRALTAAGLAIAALVAIVRFSAGPASLPLTDPAREALPDDTAPGDPSMVGEAFTASIVTLHAGPGPDHAVLREIAPGVQLNVSNTVQNDHRYVVHEGVAGWVPDRSIAWRSGSISNLARTFTATTDLNLRAEPSTSGEILVVVPSGAVVTTLGEESNGFHKVSRQGTTGWAATACLG